MLLRRIAIENVRSFLERQELTLEGQISIIIGPNGGGKTNLLDTAVVMLRRFLLATRYFVHTPRADQPDRWELRYNDQLSSLTLEKHSDGRESPQIVEVEIEVTAVDVKNMATIQAHADEAMAATKKRFDNSPWEAANGWEVSKLFAGQHFVYRLQDGALHTENSKEASDFLSYLQLFEIDNQLRAELGQIALQLPMVYLPVNRTSAAFHANIGLYDYNDYEEKRSSDATSSRNGRSILQLAIGRLAQKYRLLQEEDNQSAREALKADKNLKALSEELKGLGYDWELRTINALRNEYDVALSKQGTSFLVSAASSGERELLTYLFAIYALNVRNALIVIDEPELHLHPKWQLALLHLFEKLSKSTGNQFLMATHSPTFVSPASIQYVSRVYSENQRSRIVRLNSEELPNAKHLFNIVNTQNNERVFFCDKVVLVEGVSDRIFFERVIEAHLGRGSRADEKTVEVVSVGGKGLFSAYQKLLEACAVETQLIADQDYLEQIGDESIKCLFVLNATEIKKK
ncbi:AAA family ATPase [Methylocystis sp.]|uniref:AAA family ATPase n=1 Tax=Methylocystis sp. TaxID=1911079 RepID=UPI003DA302AB